MNAEVDVVVCAEVVSPELLAVNLVADRILKVVSVEEMSVDVSGPCLCAVGVGFAVAELLILEGVPAVGGVSYGYVLVISVVLNNRVYGVIAAILITERLSSYGSYAQNIIGRVVFAVVVVPDLLTVSNILDSIFGVEAVDNGSPDLAAVGKCCDIISLCVHPFGTVQIVVVNEYLLVGSVVFCLNKNLRGSDAVLREGNVR